MKFIIPILMCFILIHCVNGFRTTLPTVLRTPDSAFRKLKQLSYPWDPKYFFMTLDGYPKLRVNYIDEGKT